MVFITQALRLPQLIFSIIVLALSVVLIHGQTQGHVPSVTSFAACCGGLGILVSIVAFVVVLIRETYGIIPLIFDSVCTLLVGAGGIAFAATLKTGSCSNVAYIISNPLIRAGGTDDGIPVFDPSANLKGRCEMAQAVAAFLFFAFATFLATTLIGVTSGGNSRSKTFK